MMKAYMEMVACFWKNQKGQGMVEYALILALIVVVGVVGMSVLGPQISTMWNTISTTL